MSHEGQVRSVRKSRRIELREPPTGDDDDNVAQLLREQGGIAQLIGFAEAQLPKAGEVGVGAIRKEVRRIGSANRNQDARSVMGDVGVHEGDDIQKMGLLSMTKLRQTKRVETKMRAGSKRLIREINEALVLDVVREHETVARSVISEKTGLSAATVTGITGSLLELGLLREVAVERDTGGRPARLLSLGREAVFSVGVMVARSQIVAVLVDLTGSAVERHALPLTSTEPDAVVDAIEAAVRHVAGTSLERAIGVGIAVSGIVDHETGTVKHSGALDWQDVELGRRVSAAVGLDVSVESYVNALAHRLLLFDADFSGRDCLVFSLGASLGAATIFGGAIHRGFGGTAGGFAHARIVGDAAGVRRCHCGSSNCVETWSSRWGMDQEAKRHGLDWGRLRSGASGEAARIVRDGYTMLGMSAAAIAKVFGPKVVVLATTPDLDIPQFAENSARSFVDEYAHEPFSSPQIKHVRADENALAEGGAYGVLSGMFTALA